MAETQSTVPDVRLFQVRREESYYGEPDLPLQGPIEGAVDAPLRHFKAEVLAGIGNSGMEAAVRNQNNPVLLVGGMLQSAGLYLVADTLLPASSGDLFIAVMTGKALGRSMAVPERTVTAIVPLKTMAWKEYAETLGAGGYLPEGRSLRDFSGNMTYRQGNQAMGFPAHIVDYSPPGSPDHIGGGVDADGTLRFVIHKHDGRKYGYGDEMFASMVKKFRENGVEIREIQGDWQDRDYLGINWGSNWRQFMDALDAGSSIETAAMKTFTGQQARNLGLTRVEVAAELLKGGDVLDSNARILPTFRRPDWGGDKAWNDFANNWISSMWREPFDRAAISPALEEVQEAEDPSGRFGNMRGESPETTGETIEDAPDAAVPPHGMLDMNAIEPTDDLPSGLQAVRNILLEHVETLDRDAREKAAILTQIESNLQRSAACGETLDIPQVDKPSPEIG